MRRIVKIAVRFLHTKTALCDRKDTQSRFAVNAARNIVCVETALSTSTWCLVQRFNAARSIVCRDIELEVIMSELRSFNAARSIVCVETQGLPRRVRA